MHEVSDAIGSVEPSITIRLYGPYQQDSEPRVRIALSCWLGSGRNRLAWSDRAVGVRSRKVPNYAAAAAAVSAAAAAAVSAAAAAAVSAAVLSPRVMACACPDGALCAPTDIGKID